MLLKLRWPLAVFALLVLLAACGYRPGPDAELTVPADVKSIAIVGVDNPTMATELPQQFRSLFRDELSKRGYLVWEDRNQAVSLVQLSILGVTTDTKVRDPQGNTIKYAVTVTLRAQVRRRVDNAPVWDSGPVAAYESFFGLDDSAARRKALDLAVRQLTDRLTRSY